MALFRQCACGCRTGRLVPFRWLDGLMNRAFRWPSGWERTRKKVGLQLYFHEGLRYTSHDLIP